jgi:hypothetical protein
MAGMALLMPVNRAGAVEYEIFPRDQPTVWPHNNGVQQARFFDAGCQGLDIAKGLPIAITDFDFGDW